MSNILMHQSSGHLVSTGGRVRWEKCAGIRPQNTGLAQAPREQAPFAALPTAVSPTTVSPVVTMPVFVPTADAPTGVPPSAPGRSA